MRSNQFVKLTGRYGDPVYVTAPRVTIIQPCDSSDNVKTNVHVDGFGWFLVRESPAEVLALLAGEGEGKAEGIEDVVDKLREHAKEDATRGVEGLGCYTFSADQIARLVAYFDGRKTDA